MLDRQLCVLYVDDEALSVHFSSKVEVLQVHGLDVVVAASIPEARRQLAILGRLLDCLIVDMLMPHEGVYSAVESHNGALTGLLFLREMRALHANLPAVIVSVSSVEQLGDLTYFAPLAYVQRPALPSEIATAVITLVRNASD